MSDDLFPFSDHDRPRKYHSGRGFQHHDSDHDQYDRGYAPHDRRSYRGHDEHHGFHPERFMLVFERIIRNKMLLALLIIGAIAVLIAGVVLAIIFAPVLLRIVEYIFGGGLNGIIDLVRSILSVVGAGEGK